MIQCVLFGARLVSFAELHKWQIVAEMRSAKPRTVWGAGIQATDAVFRWVSTSHLCVPHRNVVHSQLPGHRGGGWPAHTSRIILGGS